MQFSPIAGKTMKTIARICVLVSFILVTAVSPCSCAQTTRPQAVVQEPQKVTQPVDNDELDGELADAVRQGQRERADELISKGANVNTTDGTGRTPLYSAVWNQDKGMVEFLLSKNAEVNVVPDNDEGTPLLYAVWRSDLEITKLLVVHGARMDLENCKGWTAFRWAVYQGEPEIIQFFIATGAAGSSLQGAVCTGDLARIERFVEQGGDVDTKDEQGWSLLYWAASMGQDQVGEYLLNKGAQAEMKIYDNIPILHMAARSGASHLIKLLISKGADVNAQDTQGRTPLHQAVMTGQKEVAEVLLAHGADVTVKDNRGQTVLDWAKQRNHTEIFELLLSDKSAMDSALLGAAEQGGHSTCQGIA